MWDKYAKMEIIDPYMEQSIGITERHGPIRGGRQGHELPRCGRGDGGPQFNPIATDQWAGESDRVAPAESDNA